MSVDFRFSVGQKVGIIATTDKGKSRTVIGLHVDEQQIRTAIVRYIDDKSILRTRAYREDELVDQSEETAKPAPKPPPPPSNETTTRGAPLPGKK